MAHIGLMNISNSIPSSFTIANTQVAVPAVNSLQGSLKSIVSLTVGVSTALTVLLVITCIGSAFTAVGSGTSCALFPVSYAMAVYSVPGATSEKLVPVSITTRPIVVLQ